MLRYRGAKLLFLIFTTRKVLLQCLGNYYIKNICHLTNKSTNSFKITTLKAGLKQELHIEITITFLGGNRNN